MISDTLALARALAPARGLAAPSPSLPQAQADLRSAQRLHQAAPMLGLALGGVALVVLSMRMRRG